MCVNYMFNNFLVKDVFLVIGFFVFEVSFNMLVDSYKIVILEVLFKDCYVLRYY